MLVLEWDCGMMTGAFQLMLNAVRLQYVMKLVWNYSREVLVMTRCLCTGTFPGNPLTMQVWEWFGVNFWARESSLVWLSAAEPAGVLFSKNTSWRAGIYSSWICESSWGWERLSSSFCERALALLWYCRARLPPPANLSPSAGLEFQWGQNPVEFQMSCS